MKKYLFFLALALVPVLWWQRLSLHDLGAWRTRMARHSSRTLRVGVDWPFATNEDGADKGLLLAQEELNARGVAGRRIQLVLRDDQLDASRGRRIAVDFAADPRVVAVLGYYDDNLAVKASPIYEQSRLLHLVTGANNTFLTTHGFKYLIRTVLSNNRIGAGLARACVGLGYRKFAIISETGAFGEDLAYHFGNELDALDARLAFQTEYVRGTTDFRNTINDLKAARADLVLVAGFERESAWFIKQARDMGLQTQILGSFADTPLVHAIAGSALEGAMNYDIWDIGRPTPENRAFVAKYRARFHCDPTSSAAQNYDALHILAQAVETTGSTDGLDLAYAIRCMPPWDGANGTYQFDSNGELASKEIFLYQYRGGKPVLIQSCPTFDQP